MSDTFYKNTRKVTPEELAKLRESNTFEDSGGVGVLGAGRETTPGIVERTVDTMGDMAISGIQGTAFNMADDIIETVDPAFADKFRNRWEQAQENSPILSTLSNIASPNPAAKLKALSKVGGLTGKFLSAAPEAASSALNQYGTTGDVGVLRTVGETLASKALTKAVGGLAIGDRLKRRASATNSNTPSAIKRYTTKAGRGFEDDLIKDELLKLEKTGLFEPGIRKFDVNDLSFKPIDPVGTLTKAKGAVLPPSDKEIVKRLYSMKDDLGETLQSIVEKKKNVFKAFPGDEYFDDLLTEMKKADYIEPKSVEKVYRNVLDRLYATAPNEINLTDIYNVKKQLNAIIGDKAFKKTIKENPDRATAFRKAVNYLDTLVEDYVDDPTYRELNKWYGTAAEALPSVRDKIRKGFEDAKGAAGAAAGRPLYRAAKTLENNRDFLMEVSSQIGNTLENSPNLQDYFRGVGAAIIPKVMSPKREPQSIQNIPMQLIKTKLPRDVEGILANKEILLAKVAQQYPQAFEQVKFVVEERPEDIESMMPMILNMLPHAFESDKYGRINNKILDPLMQKKARGDIMEDSRLSNTQKINMINKLNRTNILEDY